jgi:hypothetical protein
MLPKAGAENNNFYAQQIKNAEEKRKQQLILAYNFV